MRFLLFIILILLAGNNDYIQQMEILEKNYSAEQRALIRQSVHIIILDNPIKGKTPGIRKQVSSRLANKALSKSKKAKTDQDKLIWYLAYKKYKLNGKPYEYGLGGLRNN